MAIAKRRIFLVGVVALGVGWPALAQERGSTPTQAERAFADIQRRDTASENVQQAAYSNLPVNGTALTTAPMLAAPTIAPPASGPLMYPPAAGPPEMIYPPPSEAWSNEFESVYRSSDWNFGLDLIGTQSHLTRGRFGSWPDEGELAFRFNLGYEDQTGYGVRARFWGFNQEVSPPVADVELTAASLNIDFYKRVFIEDTELVFGAGPAGSGLEFHLTAADTSSQFSGGGASVFVEGFHPIYRWERTDLGFVGRGRLSLVEGEWEDTTGSIIPDTEHDSMSVAEIGWGLELRRRFGPCEDHHWYAGLLIEHQRWDSAMMGEFLDSNLAFSGANFNFGVAW